MDLTRLLSVQNLLTLLSLLAAYYYYRRSRRVKALTCNIGPPVKVDLSYDQIKGTAREKLQIRYEDRSLPGLSVFQAKLINTGTEPVTKSDLEKPISFGFPKESTLLDSEVIDSSKQVDVEAEDSNTTTSSWRFRSLEPGEFALFQFLVEGSIEDMPQVTGRVLGMPKGIAVKLSSDKSQPAGKTQGLSDTSWRWIVVSGLLAGLLLGRHFLRDERVLWPPMQSDIPAGTIDDGEQHLTVGTSVVLDGLLWRITYTVENRGDEAVDVIWSAGDQLILQGTVRPQARIEVERLSMVAPKVLESQVTYGQESRVFTWPVVFVPELQLWLPQSGSEKRNILQLEQ